MPTPPNDDTRTLFKLIGDGAWHSYEEVRDKIASTVPPGRALRKYQERIDYARKYKNDPAYDTQASEDERIFLGRKACGQIAITSWKGRGIQYRGEGPNKEIRIRPGFQTWGVATGSESPDEDPSRPDRPADDSGPPGPDQQTQEEAPDVETPFAQQGVAQLPPALVQAVAEQTAAPRPEPRPDPGEPREPVEGEPYYDWVGVSPPVTDLPETTVCEICGAGVINGEAHEDFHRRYELIGTRADMALFAESEIRTLLGDVMGQVLDDFQAGMERYLDMHFADVLAALRASRRPPDRWSEGQNRGPFG